MNGQEYTIIGILFAAVGALWKIQQNAYKSNEQEKKEALQKLQDNNEKRHQEEMERHDKQEIELKQEIKHMHEERKEEMKVLNNERTEERKEWLGALNDNTEQLKNVANKLETIPYIQKDLDNLKEDVIEIKQEIKEKINGVK